MKLRFGSITAEASIFNENVYFFFKEIHMIIECLDFYKTIRCQWKREEDITNFHYIKVNPYILQSNIAKAREGNEEFIEWLQEIIDNDFVEILSAFNKMRTERIEEHEQALEYEKKLYNNFKDLFLKELIFI